jgi:IMP dehydrogenase
MFTLGHTFDDVLLTPKYSTITSRDDVDLNVRLPRNLKLNLPFVSANMKSVTGPKMARAIAELGGLGILHRFDDYSNLITNFCKVNINPDNLPGLIGASVGIKDRDLDLARKLYDNNCKVICVDVAHGHHSSVEKFVINLRTTCPDVCIIAGNIVTHEGANMLWEAGADIIKIGVGGGSLCLTRIETGNGYPQLSALHNVTHGEYKHRGGFDEPPEWPMFISDGGIKNAGDCTKALCFADLVMIGNLFAGTDEAPGDTITVSGKIYKSYAGSSTHKQKYIEGVIGLVPYKGSVSSVVLKLSEGIKSGCSYQGVSNVASLQNDPKFVIISNAGLIESHPHDVKL